MEKLTYEFYHRPCIDVAKDLVGKVIIHKDARLRITETEIYWGESDTACHASRGRTQRTEVLYMAQAPFTFTFVTASTGC